MMRKIIILGNSVAGVKAAEVIRQKDQECEIILLCEKQYLPYQFSLLTDYLAKDISEDKLYYRSKSFFEQNRIHLVFDKEIIRINFKKNQITTADKEQFSFDTLILSDTFTARFPEIKGNNKFGVWEVYSISDVRAILETVPITDTIILEASSLAGVKAACALTKHGKEVIFISSLAQLLRTCGDEKNIQALQAFMEGIGVRIFWDDSVIEILGEGEVKAVRLKNGKVLSAELVIFSEVRPDLKIFHESNIVMNQRICVDQKFRTNLPHVFAVDRVCEMEAEAPFCLGNDNLAELEEQGRVVGLTILGEQVEFQPPQASSSLFRFDDFSLVLEK